MNRAGKLMTVLVVATLGLWGCAKNPANTKTQAEMIRSLEDKCAKLEEDYRTVAFARDDARKKAVSMEDENKRLQKQIESQKAQLLKDQQVEKQLAKEQDELHQQMEARTNERDVLQVRCDRLKKGLQNLLGQDEAYLAAPTQNVANSRELED